MVAHLSGTDLAVAGHAVALAGWHQVFWRAPVTKFSSMHEASA